MSRTLGSCVSFAQAQAFCAWLGKLTGQKYRLPNEDEVKAIYESARGNENTLDYWAGYALNPDDARRLWQKVAEIAGPAPLLRPVGQFQGQGEEERSQPCPVRSRLGLRDVADGHRVGHDLGEAVLLREALDNLLSKYTHAFTSRK